MPDRDPLTVSRQVYRLRILGLALGFICVAAVLSALDSSRWIWALLAFHCFLWPHLAWSRAKKSSDPQRAEKQHLVVDSALGGVFVALMHFNLLPSALLVAMLSMDKLGWGVRFVLRASTALALACGFTAILTNFAMDLTTTMPQIVASLPLMIVYPVAVASTANKLGRQARERRDAAEEMAALRDQLAHIGRVGTMGEMAAGLAHELNQPLAVIHLEATTGLELIESGDASGALISLQNIIGQSLRAGEIVRRVRQFSRREQSARQPIDIVPLIHEVLALLDNDLRLDGVQTTLTLRERLPKIMGNRVELQQVLVNLIRNAREAMARPQITTRRLSIQSEILNNNVRVTITDTGGGLDADVASKLFHPFQTTKPTGLGLGLSICESLIEGHGGRVGAGPHPPGGATFFFELPAAQGPTA